MKKILLGVLCGTACAVVASADPVEQVVSTIEVRAISSPLTNVVVAIPGLDLAEEGDVSVSNLVKTTNLAAGDKLVAFTEGDYESWELNASKVWEKTTTLINVTPTGIVNRAGTAATTKTLGVGSGIWLSRTASGTIDQSTGELKPFYVYARQPSSTNTIVKAGKAALVGNPTIDSKSPTISDSADKDKILVPSNAGNIEYTYTNGKWNWIEGFDPGTLLPVTKESVTPPAIPSGTGFWYISKGSSNVSIDWAD